MNRNESDRLDPRLGDLIAAERAERGNDPEPSRATRDRVFGRVLASIAVGAVGTAAGAAAQASGLGSGVRQAVKWSGKLGVKVVVGAIATATAVGVGVFVTRGRHERSAPVVATAPVDARSPAVVVSPPPAPPPAPLTPVSDEASWLARARTAIEDGRLAEARESLARLRERFPRGASAPEREALEVRLAHASRAPGPAARRPPPSSPTTGGVPPSFSP